MAQKTKLILSMMTILILVSACSSISMTSIYNNDEKIRSETNTFNIGKTEQEVRDKMIEAKVDNIEGMETIWSFTAEQDMDIELSGEMSVRSGKAKLVLILPDNTLTLITEKGPSSADDMMITQTISLKEGLNRIKIVAEKNTQLELKLSSSNGEFQRLGIDW